MKYKVWERKLAKGIATLSKAERERVIEYYREMYDEMTSSGKSEAAVLAEFGLPEQCAKRARTGAETTERKGTNTSVPKEKKKVSAAEVVGLVFFTVLLLLPLLAVAVAVIVSFGAVSLSGGAVALAGLVFAAYYPFAGIASTYGVLAGVGMGIAASGVGCLLFVAFFWATKGTAIALGKALKAIYKRR